MANGVQVASNQPMSLGDGMGGTAIKGLATLFGGPAGGVIADLGMALGSRLFGSGKTVNTSTSRTGFDASQLPLFRQLLGQYTGQSEGVGQQISQMSAAQRAALDADITRQLEAVQGMWGQQQADTNRAYDARLGAAQQKAIGSGTYNTSVLPGMQMLVERERGAAQRRITAQQQGAVGGILGQRAALMNQLRGQETASQIARLGNILSMAGQPLATTGRSTRTYKRDTSETKGLFS